MLGILCLDIPQGNDWASMQEAHLLALSILFFDKAVSKCTFFGQVAFQSVSEPFIDTEGQFSEVVRCLRCDSVVLVQACNNRVVFLQLYELRII